MDRYFTDTPVSVRYPTYTRANAGEVIPDPMSPLTVSLCVRQGIEPGWRNAYVGLGTCSHDEFDDYTTNTVGQFGGYLYLNMSWTRIYGVRCPGMTPEIVDFQYFGTMPGIPPYADEARPTDEDPRATERLQELFINGYCFGRDDLADLRDDRDEVDAVVAARPDLAALSNAELVEHARSLMPLYRRLFERHISTSAACGVGIGTVAGVCDAIGRPDLVMTLVSGVGDVDSAAPSAALWQLSRLVARSAALSTEFDRGVEGLIERVRLHADRDHTPEAADSATFLAEGRRFLERFGSRGPNEWELRSHTWGTRPEIVLAALDVMRKAPDHDSPAAHAAEREAERATATAEVRAALAGNAEALGQFEAGLRCALLFAPGRERSKTTNIKLVHEQRLALRELGRRAAEAGHLASAEQVFMLTDDELADFAADPSKLGPELAEREQTYLTLADVEPPFIVYREAPPVSSWPRRDAATFETWAPGSMHSGIPGCAGVAEGRARIVLDPADPAGLEPGDILVAPVTDPAWTPLFVPAAAVVCDVGAQITHAVIVSRELGIPCVVSVTGATKSIPDGALIRVDGAAGTVTLL